MKHINSYNDYIKENINYLKNQENMNEGLKHWLATFLMMVNLGIVPPTVLASGEKAKMEFAQSEESIEQVSVKFKSYYSKNNFYNTPELAWEDFQNLYGKSALSLNDILSNVNIDTNVNSEVPKPTNFVNDYAELILSQSDEDSLNAKIARYAKTSGMEIAIATINTMTENNYIESVTQDIFNVWGVGKTGSDNGILITVAEKEHAWRIQTGYGAEIVLPDILCGRMGRNILVPAFKEGNYYAGLNDLVDAIIEEVGTNSADIEMFKKKYQEEKDRKAAALKQCFIDVISVIGILAILSFLITLIVKSSIRRKELLEKSKSLINDIQIILDNFAAETEDVKDLKYIKKIIDDFNYFVNNTSTNTKPTIKEEIVSAMFEYNKNLSSYITKVQRYKKVYKEASVSDQQLKIAKEYNIKIEELQKELSKYKLNITKNINDDYLEGIVSHIKQNIDTDKIFSLCSEMNSSLASIKSQYQSLYNTKDSIPRMEKEISEYKNYIDIWVNRLNKYNLTSAVTKLNGMISEFEKVLKLDESELFKKYQYLESIRKFVDKSVSEEEKRRERRKREEKAAAERRRREYHSSSSSYSSSSSSFGGFGGGRSGGGGSSGSW